MKKQYIFPVILGGTFFAIPYLALSMPFVHSATIAVAAYGAGWLMTKNDNDSNKSSITSKVNAEELKEAKRLTNELAQLAKQVKDKKLIANINEIAKISENILKTIEEKPEKKHQANNFLNYYLPVTIKILKRYDEIEDQNINTPQTTKFMKSIENMIEKIKTAFTTQLSNMYQTDMIDTDAEIRVFESMLKADGFLTEDDLDVKKGGI